MQNSLLKKRPNSSSVLRDFSSIEIKGQCGSGTFGMVYKGVDKDSGDLVALKKIKMENEHQGFPITAIREIKILKVLKHPNIVFLREIIACSEEIDERFKSGDIFMVFEYVDYDLAGLLGSDDVILSPDHIRCYAKQLFEGVYYMHKNNILHRDLKGANILISKNNHLKIGDWGLARSYSSRNPRMTVEVVTQWYRAPELCLKTNEYGEGVDIWACGCIFAELFNRRAIMMGTTDIHQLELIYQLTGSPEGNTLEYFKTLPKWETMQLKEIYPPKLQQKFSQRMDIDAVALLEKMLSLHPKDRISASDALGSTFFWGTPTNLKPLIEPDALPKFVIENGHEFEVKQHREKLAQLAEQREKERAIEREKRKLEALNKQKLNNSSGNLSGSGNGGSNIVRSGKFKAIAPNKSKTNLEEASTGLESLNTDTSTSNIDEANLKK